MANWIRNFGIRIGSEGWGVWALRRKQVGLPVGLAEPLGGEVGPVSRLLWIAIASQARATGVLFKRRSTTSSELARTRGIRLSN